MKICSIKIENILISGIIACLNMLLIVCFSYSDNIDVNGYIGFITILFFLLWIFGIVICESHDREIEEERKWNEDIKECLGEFYNTAVSQKNNRNGRH